MIAVAHSTKYFIAATLFHCAREHVGDKVAVRFLGHGCLEKRGNQKSKVAGHSVHGVGVGHEDDAFLSQEITPAGGG